MMTGLGIRAREAEGGEAVSLRDSEIVQIDTDGSHRLADGAAAVGRVAVEA